MPRYELSVIFRLMERQKKIDAVTNAVKYLLGEGINVRKVQSLGDRGLPYKHTAHGQTYFNGSYILFDVDFRRNDREVVKRYFDNNSDVLKLTCVNYDAVYAPEKPCSGMQPIDYEKILDELKQPKTKKVPKILEN